MTLVLGSVASFQVQWSEGLIPLWMVALWINLAAHLDCWPRWLTKPYQRAAVLGALGGPAAYWAGQRLGAMQLHSNTALGLAAVALEWMVAMPALAALTNRTPRAHLPDPTWRRVEPSAEGRPL